MGVHKGLVAAVIGMAVLIVAGIIAVAVGLMVKSRDADFSFLIADSREAPAAPAPMKPAAPASPNAFRDITLQLAPGETIAASHATQDRLIIRVRSARGTGRLIIFDPRTGAITGRVLIKLAP